MGTRGTLGFRVNGVDKLTYNHYDSYPDWLGKDVVEWCRTKKGQWDAVKARATALEDVSDRKPTMADVERLSQYANLGVSCGDPYQEWYVLLRETQGELDAILDAAVFESQAGFITDSRFCEYGYIVNLDDMVLEFYEGFQKEPHNKGRYANEPGSEGYFSCALVGSFPLDDIPEDWVKIFPEEE